MESILENLAKIKIKNVETASYSTIMEEYTRALFPTILKMGKDIKNFLMDPNIRDNS